MGTGVRIAALRRRSGPALAVATASTLFVVGVSLGGVVLLGGRFLGRRYAGPDHPFCTRPLI